MTDSRNVRAQAPLAPGMRPRPSAVEIGSVVCGLFAFVTLAIWGFTAWPLPWNIVAGIGAPAVAVLVWALFVSPRAVLAVLLARVSLAAKNRLGLDIEKRHQDALHSALMSGVRAALQRGSVGEAIVAEAVRYAQSSVPDAIAKLAPAGGVLAELARAKIDEIARASIMPKVEVALPAQMDPRRYR